MSVPGYLVLSTAAILTLIGLAQLLMLSLKQKLVLQQNPIAKESRDIMTDPTRDQLRAEGKFPQPIILTLQDGRKCPCVASSIGDNIVVHFQNIPDAVSWDKRRQAAARVLALST